MTRPIVSRFRMSPRLALSLAFLLMAVGCSRGGPSGQLSTADLAAIRSASLAYPEAWLSNDPEKVRATLAEDAVLMPSGGMQPVEGMPAIDDFFWPTDGPPMEVTEYVMEPAEVAGTTSLAFVRGSMTLTFEMESEGALQTFTTAGTYLMILRPVIDGSWRISRYTWNHPPWELIEAEPLSSDGGRSTKEWPARASSRGRISFTFFGRQGSGCWRASRIDPRA